MEIPIHNQTTRKARKAVEILNKILRLDQYLALALFRATTLADILVRHQLSAPARRNPVQAVLGLPVNQIAVIDLREPARMVGILLHQSSTLALRSSAQAVKILPLI